MSTGKVHLTVQDGIAAVVFDRPEARNAMTWSMYDELAAICQALGQRDDIRAATLRGAGGQAFVAGTDIEQFLEFESGDDGIRYEAVIDERVQLLESLPFPTVAVIDGYAIGGGLAMAAACDFRVATPAAVFGVPIARTLGNCLSSANTARVVAGFGAARAKRMLLLAETIAAAEARDCGFVHEIVEPEALDAKVAALCQRLAGNAPLTIKAAKETIRRLVVEGLSRNDDLVRECYGSRDFRIGIEAFLAKQRPRWTGR
ncbi:enoyl-CoA hydratase/isomerase family protein [Bordetella sp. BOR01]|uniref:enoyl-CoA hydratase/isomerase family protein n=1 Tax=Bordetella sp. BOR01 TaxID=2854779 RepID=UPI001C45BB9A|nr:enoyl-CoA hydratase/isomerase family protein [Bordetella sp. BOR01]MBV7481994.1 enoyl-CoA hydratase/isomerase family protein [Bordetella sp. BOR01]